MCLGIPGQVVALLDVPEDLAEVDVSGVRRMVDVGLLAEEDLGEGDWVLVHVGFAMSKIDEEEAASALAELQRMGTAFTDEMEALLASSSRAAPGQGAGDERERGG